MRRHTSRPSRWQKTAQLSHNCLLPGAALHHWPPVPALHLGGGSSESKGEPSSARPDHITQGSGLWCGSDRERTNPGPQPHRPAQCRPRPVVSSLWKNIFECLVHSLTFTPPHAALIYLGFSEGGGGGSAKYAVGCDKLLWRDARSVSSGFTSGQKVLVCSGGSWEELIKVRAEGWWADCSS